MTRRERRVEQLIREAYQLDDIASYRMAVEGFTENERAAVKECARLLYAFAARAGEECAA